MNARDRPYKCIEESLETEILRINNAYLTNESVAPSAFSVDDKLEPHSAKIQTIFMGDFKMGDHYEAGQSGAMGPGAHAHTHTHDMTFNQIWNQVSGEIDLPRLSEELRQLRLAMRKEANEPEDDIAISDVAHAEQAAKSGNGPEALEKLKSSGKWALSVAEKIGTSVAVSAIKSTLGI